jgi:pyridoxine 5'-phosphate synthase PdxJ
LGLLVAKNELELNELVAKAQGQGIMVSVFREPDIGDAVTAIALEPGPRTKRLCSALPLAFSS